jgi:hypothetical protein
LTTATCKPAIETPLKTDFYSIFLSGRQGLMRDGIFTWLRFMFVYIECSKICLRRSRLLDLAYGDGSFLLWSRRKTNYVGLDIDRYKLLIAKKNNNLLALIVADAGNLPFKAKAFDTVVTSETLEHLTEHKRQGAIEEISRVSCGHVIVTVPTIGLRGFIATILQHALLQKIGWTQKQPLGFKSPDHQTEFFPIPFNGIVPLNYLVKEFCRNGFGNSLCHEIGFMTHLAFPLLKNSLSPPVLHPRLTILVMKFEKTFAKIHFPFGQYAILSFRRESLDD